MADTFTNIPKGSGKPFALHKAGQFAAVCRDILDMGNKWQQYKDEPGKIVRRVRFIFSTAEINPDTGKPFELSREFTLSAHKKSSLRPFLEAWLGKPFKDDDAAYGALANLHKLEGRSAFISVVQTTSEHSDRTYANLSAIMPLPEALPAPTLPKYERDPYWQTLKAKYAAELKGSQPADDPFAQASEPPAPAEEFSDFPKVLEDEDEDALPF
jgi:hypothetical protein